MTGVLLFFVLLLLMLPVFYSLYFKKFITAIVLLVIIAFWGGITFYILVLSAASFFEGSPTMNGVDLTFELLGKVWFGSTAFAFILYVLILWKGLRSSDNNT